MMNNKIKGKGIGILTFPYPENRNFGAILQGYAIQKMIEKEVNQEVTLINYYPSVKGNFIRGILLKTLGKGFIEFSETFLNVTKRYHGNNDLKELNKFFDTFIVGSDQVWRPLWLKEFLPKYFFDFVDKDKKKIAFAASFGVDFWEGNETQTENIKKLAKKFDFVSVREESGKKICKDIFDIEAQWVLDPTMMIDIEDYQPIFEDYKSKKHMKKPYIAHMLLDDDEKLRKRTYEIAENLSANIIELKGKRLSLFGKVQYKYNGVSQWLTYLKDSKLVITDSFHCTVFSILFKKEFIVVANPRRGKARLINLLKKFEITGRFFDDIDKVIESGVLDKKIDYSKADKKLKEYKESSLQFLRKALGE